MKTVKFFNKEKLFVCIVNYISCDMRNSLMNTDDVRGSFCISYSPNSEATDFIKNKKFTLQISVDGEDYNYYDCLTSYVEPGSSTKALIAYQGCKRATKEVRKIKIKYLGI